MAFSMPFDKQRPLMHETTYLHLEFSIPAPQFLAVNPFDSSN